MTLRIGIDIGGTFTDLVAIDTAGTVHTHKIASTPRDYGEGIVHGLQALLARCGGEITEILHATTVASNTIEQRPNGDFYDRSHMTEAACLSNSAALASFVQRALLH